MVRLVCIEPSFDNTIVMDIHVMYNIIACKINLFCTFPMKETENNTENSLVI